MKPFSRTFKLVAIASLAIAIIVWINTPTHRTFSEIPPAEVHSNNIEYTHPIYTAIKSSGLGTSQQETALWAFEKGREYDLGYTMAAIALQESYAGVILINLDDPSFGIFHNLLGSVLTREGLMHTRCNKNRIASKLVTDNDYAASQALAELLHWDKRHKGNWSKTVMSYNAGTNYRNGKDYLKHINAHIKLLKGDHDKLYKESLRVF